MPSQLSFRFIARYRRAFLLPTIVFLCGFPSVLKGQGSFGSIAGQVLDPSGAAIPEATVKVVSNQTGALILVSSTSNGRYFVQSLEPGRYQVRVEKGGFQTAVRDNVLVSTATETSVDISLTLGSSSQTVMISASAANLQTDSPEIGTVMPEAAILDLPISLGGAATIGASGRRQIESFTFLTPGVTGNQWQKSINGGQGMSQEILYDGVDAQNIGAPGFIADSSPPYEAISEFKVQNTSYPAEYGLGLGVENYTLKSGTNQFHGDLFEFLRNDKLDARGFFNTVLPIVRQNEFGGTLGGPVLLPHYNGRNKTFFFVAYSGFQLRGGLPTNGLNTLPSVQQRAGNFSDYPFPIYDPATTRPDGSGGFTRDPFPGNLIPANRTSRVAAATLPLIPQPDFPTPNNNYVDRSYQPTSENAYSFKIDQIFSSTQHVSVSYWNTLGNTDIHGGVAGVLDPNRRDTTTNGGGIRSNYTAVVSPTMVNNIAFGYTPTSPTFCHWLADPNHGNKTLQIPGIPVDAPGYPNFSFSSPYYQLGDSQNQGLTPCQDENWAGGDDLVWMHGAHQFKFGGMFRHRRLTYGDTRNQAGSFSFDNLSTSLPDSSQFSLLGNSFASFLLGYADSASRYIPSPTWIYGDKMLALYAEDSYKASRKLSITLGLRYELPFYPIAGNGGDISELSLSVPNAGAGGLPGALIFSGSGQGARGTFNILHRNYHTGFAPRTGLAYQIANNMVFRAGYGLFYAYPNYGRLNSGQLWGTGYGYAQKVSSTNLGITPALLLDSGFPTLSVPLPNFDPTLANGSTPSFVNPSAYKPARVQSWTADLQRKLPGEILADIAYVGQKASGLTSGLENINQLNPSYLNLGNLLLNDITSPEAIAAGVKPPYAGFTGSVAQALRPYPQFSGILDMFQPTGFSTYQALQVRVQRQFASGFGFLASYTLSKTIGAFGGDTFGDVDGGGSGAGLDTYNQKLEKALSPSDQTHYFVLSLNYELPFGRGKSFASNLSPFLNSLVAGWQFNSIQTYASGTPISVYGGPPLPIFNYAGNRPNWISPNVRSNVSMSGFDPATDVYLNSSAFADPAPFTFGNAPPVLPNVRNPAFFAEDISLFKRFGITERSFVELRGEAFNVFNRVVFGGPATNIDQPQTFGRIYSQANTPRVLQVAAKFVF